MNRIALILALAMAFASACNDDPSKDNIGTTDAGASDTEQSSDSEHDDRDTNDSDTQNDSGADAEEDAEDSPSLQVSAADNWEVSAADGAATEYWADATPTIEGETRKLLVLFERYMNRSYEGTFELGPGTVDENFGNCAHCLFIRGDTRDRAFFADSGHPHEQQRPLYSNA